MLHYVFEWFQNLIFVFVLSRLCCDAEEVHYASQHSSHHWYGLHTIRGFPKLSNEEEAGECCYDSIHGIYHKSHSVHVDSFRPIHQQIYQNADEEIEPATVNMKHCAPCNYMSCDSTIVEKHGGHL